MTNPYVSSEMRAVWDYECSKQTNFAPAVLETTGQLDRGVWYRRDDGSVPYAARWVADRAIEVTPLHPNTLESDGAPKTLFDERFQALYCRSAELRG